jgi:mannose-1-phosphate guanylyltransferase/mannose-6-phosphate isomerase
VRSDVRKVVRFVEKPNALKAAELLARGDHWWNAGIFLVSAKTLLAALERHAADIFETAGLAMHGAKVDGHFLRPGPAEFLNIRSESIDYAVLEHHDRIAAAPFAGAWSDVGSWNAVAELADADSEGNRAVGQTLAIDCQRTYLHAPHRVVVALGLSDILVIDTPDAVLVASASEAERVKDVVSKLRERGLSVATQHRRVARPWGEYDAIDSGDRFQVKRITVKPGEQLSLQMHHHRAEHWIVVRGTARVTRGDETFLLSENESTYIPLGTVHRLENPGRVPLEMIEVQSGSYLGEDDIVRFEDTYGRVVPPPGEAP